jgi:hypothetical protein
MTELLTRTEATNYEETARHPDVLAFVDQLCRRTKLARSVGFGKSGEGQPMVALVVSDRDCFTPALARFGSHYRRLLGWIDVLLKTYSYIDFPRRCAERA